MKSLVVRVILIAAGFALAWIADGQAHELAGGAVTSPEIRLALVVLTTFAVGAGMVVLLTLFSGMNTVKSLDSPDAILCADLCAIYFSFAFGVTDAPLWDGHRISTWNFLLVLGFLPLLLAFITVVIDAHALYAQKTDTGEKDWTKTPAPQVVSPKS